MSVRGTKRMIKKSMHQHLAPDIRVFVHRKESWTSRGIFGVETRRAYTVEVWPARTNRGLAFTCTGCEPKEVVVSMFDMIIEKKPHWLKYFQRQPEMNIN